jgi:hypothetical protein
MNVSRRALLLILPLVVVATLGRADEAEKPAAKKLPRVLLIGDSISIGYTGSVTKLLAGKADVRRIPGNGQHSGTGLKKLDAWLGNEPWDVIHFNWGLWDLCYRSKASKSQGRRDKKNGKITYTLDQYEKNMRQLAKRLKATKSKLIWAATTPVPPGEAGRIEGDAAKYNAVAAKIMQEHGIVINDLHAHILPVQKKYASRPGDVHFTRAGSMFLAEKVAASILEELGKGK